MSKDLTTWLQELGLGKYESIFAENDVDIRALPALTEQDLKELGVSLGHRRLLQQAISTLVKHGGALTETHSPDSTRFETDARLSAWERQPGERKPVTMLFADIADSTALTEQLDAEETYDLLYAATRKMCEAVENNRGTVGRFMGDGIMAMFGAPVASEYHAGEACEAALEMQQTIKDYANEIEVSLRIRVGLHSGEVVVLSVGEGDKAEYDASGPTVPIAARMEQAASPGEVYITSATQSLAAHRIETEALKPISVKGISEPIPVFALRRVRSLQEAASDLTRTPFVGRRAELDHLRAMLDTCAENGSGQTVYVRGDPGIGKTRFVEEFARIAAAGGMSVYRCLVLPFGVGKGQGAIQSLVRSILDNPDDSSLREAEDKLLANGVIVLDDVVFLNDLLELPQPSKLLTLYDAMETTVRNMGKQRVASAIVGASARDRPILVIVEDIHWADTVVLGHLSSLANTVMDCSVLLLVTSRIEGDQLDQSWRATVQSPFLTIDLGPLRRRDSIALISAFIDSTNPTAEKCLERAAGNPLFLEQLAHTAREGSITQLPESIQSLILSRIDRLEHRDKWALQTASIIGQRFDEKLLRYLAEDKNYDCRELVAHNLVQREGAGYLFAHALVQEGVYSSLLHRQRSDLHRRAAEWFEQIDPVLYAQHLDYAGDDQAPEAYERAIQYQMDNYRHESALALIGRSFEIAPSKKKFALKYLEGEVLRAIGMVKKSIDAYQDAVALAPTDKERCQAWIGVAEGQRLSERHVALLQSLAKAQSSPLVEEEMPAELARIHQLRCGVHFMRGETRALVEESHRAIECARRASSPAVSAQSLSCLADAEYARGRMISAYEHIDRCIQLSQQHSLGRVLAANLSFRGQALYYMCRIEEALNDCRAALELARKVSQPRAEMVASAVAVYIIADMGDPAEGKRWANLGLESAGRLDASLFVAICLEYLARFLAQEGNLVEADSTVREALAILRSSGFGMRFVGPRALGALARITKDERERRSAIHEAQELLRRGLPSHNYLLLYRDAMEVFIENQDWGAVEVYAQLLEEYTRDQPLPWSEFFVARGRALAAVGSGRATPATRRKIERLHVQGEQLRLAAALPALHQTIAVEH